jgi:hypothetical protein
MELEVSRFVARMREPLPKKSISERLNTLDNLKLL